MSDLVSLIGEQFQLIRVGSGLLSCVEHDSLRIWTETGRWQWYSKGIGGDLRDWLNYNNYSDDEKSFYLENYNPISFQETERLLDHDDFIHTIGQRKYTDYIKSRGINEDTFAHFELESINSDVVIPIKNEKNKRIGSLIRYFSRKPKYKKLYVESPAPFWNIHEFNPEYNTVIFEGTWAAMRFYQISKEMGIPLNLFAGLGFTVTKSQIEYLNGLDNVIWLLDSDTDKQGNLLDKVLKKRDNIKKHNANHKIIINRKMPDEISDEGIKSCILHITT